MRILGVLVLVLALVTPALAYPDSMPVVPGRAVGPVRLAMWPEEATAAAAGFAAATGCTIDVAQVAGEITAIGTRWGGCLELDPDADRLAATAMEAVGIGGSAATMVLGFGMPIAFPLDLTESGDPRWALMWPDRGLCAVAVMDHAHHGVSVIVYVAVIPIGQDVPPYQLIHAALSNPGAR